MIKKRSVMISGHATSITLEEPFWEELKKIAAAEEISINELIAQIDTGRGDNLSSALRVYVLERLKSK